MTGQDCEPVVYVVLTRKKGTWYWKRNVYHTLGAAKLAIGYWVECGFEVEGPYTDYLPTEEEKKEVARQKKLEG